jgi:hypothetical protein
MPFTADDAALKELYACQLSAGAQSGERLANFAQLDAGGLGDSSDVLAAKAHYLYHKVNALCTSALYKHLPYICMWCMCIHHMIQPLE